MYMLGTVFIGSVHILIEKYWLKTAHLHWEQLSIWISPPCRHCGHVSMGFEPLEKKVHLCILNTVFKMKGIERFSEYLSIRTGSQDAGSRICTFFITQTTAATLQNKQ